MRWITIITEKERKQLQITATKVRIGSIDAVYQASSGHPGGSLSAADLFTYLYMKEMNVDPKNEKKPDRDRFVLSKGHCTPGLYSTLAEKGYFKKEDLKTFRQIGSHLQGHPDMKGTPGVDMTTGSLGQGISAACGMAKAGKIANADYRVYTLVGDGESQEGQVWEAAAFASKEKLDNLCVILDFNGLQIDGKIIDIGGYDNFREKFEAFGFDVIEIDGHDFDDIEKGFTYARTVKNKPTCIVAKTVKGKGVSYMENQAGWHGNAPNEEQYNLAMKELNEKLNELEGK